MEYILRNGPWSFDRSLLVLNRISGDEQPSDQNMHFASFWVRIYELPLNLRSDSMAKKIGSVLGNFEEMDNREVCRNGRFLRIKVKLDLRAPLKRGTMVKVKEKNLRVHFKYERLPLFCYVCGRLGHQMKDCETVEDLSEEGFEELEEQDLSYGQWLRASPLPKASEDQKKRDSSSGTCTRSLFQASSGHSRCEAKSKEQIEEAEVQQNQGAKEVGAEREDGTGSAMASKQKAVEIDKAVESFGAVDLSIEGVGEGNQSKGSSVQKRKWVRKKPSRKGTSPQNKSKILETSKRQLVEVMITEGTIDACGSGDKKRKQESKEEGIKQTVPEVVLETQHRLHQ
ncbi:uncharacterized protein LOC131645226 [Vicia villosa]|uniref:uncharacterized protein LOC131645226 n=1 Tax=Vicia villosa TaxID=3911 RepID=UPI00273B3D99|nr:uncharacterized protein LOC131645226 [Vicia villosa]